LKSGSPTPKEMTGSPSAFIAFAFAVIAKVKDGEIPLTLSAILFFIKHIPLVKIFIPIYFTFFFKIMQGNENIFG
jgi:hypothetical protein